VRKDSDRKRASERKRERELRELCIYLLLMEKFEKIIAHAKVYLREFLIMLLQSCYRKKSINYVYNHKIYIDYLAQNLKHAKSNEIFNYDV